eukprot:889272-Amphidinium_carterae.1
MTDSKSSFFFSSSLLPPPPALPPRQSRTVTGERGAADRWTTDFAFQGLSNLARLISGAFDNMILATKALGSWGRHPHEGGRNCQCATVQREGTTYPIKRRRKQNI